jgi:uncharacterized delta-60 repeat protein
MEQGILYKGLVFGLVGVIFAAGLPQKSKAASAGALDPIFSGDGKVITNVSNNDNARDVAIQPDGKIIVVGRSDDGVGTGDFLVVRYEPDGSLDPTFDTDGIVTTNFGSSESASAVALQSDGKIVVAGSSNALDPSNDFAVARYNPNGSLDTTFSGDGRTITDFTGGNDNASCVLIQTDGKIVAGGFATPGGNQDFGLIRYNLDGTIDPTFSGDGRATFDNGGSSNGAYDIKLQTDGKIVAVGGNLSDFVIYRINPNGTADATFDTDGMVTTNISGADYAFSIEIQPDGKIIAAGRADASSALTRYNADGSLDNSFDGDGRMIVDLNPSITETILDIKLQGDGKILAGVASLGGVFLGVNAARFNANGSLDLSFGTGGRVTTFVQASNSSQAIAISGGELLVVGDGEDILLARFNLNIKPTASNDFDGDGFSDYVIFRPSAGTWYILHSLTGAVQILGFGSNGDVPLDGDFDGDGRNDVAIYRPGAGEWWCWRSSDNTTFAVQFGAPGDKPVPGDVDKDGKTDFVFWRPANGNYFGLRSRDNFSSFFGLPFGTNGDVPVGTAIFP